MNFNIINPFKKIRILEQNIQVLEDKLKKALNRSFIGARLTRLTNWLDTSFAKINLDLKNDLLTLFERARELAKNNDVVRAYLEIMEKNIIGATGFELQSQIKDINGKLDDKLNNELEWAWYDFGKLSNGFLTIDGQMGHHEFDKLILRTFLVDGEVFIRVHKDRKNPFGVSFELVDAMSIDFTKNREATGNQNAIMMGVEIDKNYKPVYYYIKQGTTVDYQSGKEERVPAKEIIHIFKQESPQQVRGFSPLNACLNDLKQLEDLDTAELFASKVAACIGIFYEPNGQQPQGNFADKYVGSEDEKNTDPGTFVQDIAPRNGQYCS